MMQAKQHNHDHEHELSQEETHDHEDGHDHDHSRSHEDSHSHGKSLWGWLSSVLHLHGHDHEHGDLVTDQAFIEDTEGIRTIWLALAALTITSVIQIVIVAWSGSVALLADTIHNIGDGLNSVPLLIAFYLARRAATRRYNYGYSRAEDVAGIFIVLSIAFSAGVIFYESVQKFIHPEPITNLGWVAVAAIIGFLGNEFVALLQIRVGRKIGSAALVADGLHARTDGLTSLAVLLAAGGTWLGFPILDPIIGILIGVAILFITRDASVTMWYRLMDAIEPHILARAEATIEQQTEVRELLRLRMRWMGHRLHAEVTIAVDPHLTTAESHQIAERVRHELFHQVTRLSEILVHVEPWSDQLESEHQLTLHHEPVPRPITN
jgi:cation diffusion facilitator family transporter